MRKEHTAGEFTTAGKFILTKLGGNQFGLFENRFFDEEVDLEANKRQLDALIAAATLDIAIVVNPQLPELHQVIGE